MMLFILCQYFSHHLDNTILKLEAQSNVRCKVQVLDFRFVDKNLLHDTKAGGVSQFCVSQMENPEVQLIVVQNTTKSINTYEIERDPTYVELDYLGSWESLEQLEDPLVGHVEPFNREHPHRSVLFDVIDDMLQRSISQLTILVQIQPFDCDVVAQSSLYDLDGLYEEFELKILQVCIDKAEQLVPSIVLELV